MMAQSSGPAWANPNSNAHHATEVTEVIVDEDLDDTLLAPYSTLDEPVLETIMRDVRAVGQKLRVVMLPLDRNVSFGYTGLSLQESETEEIMGENQKKVIDQLKDWDLW